MVDAVPLYEPLLNSIKRVLAAAAGPQHAIMLLDNFPADKAFLEGFANYLQTSLETSSALGRSLIVAKDAVLSRKAHKLSAKYVRAKKNLDVNSFQWFKCDSGVNISFDILPESAIKALLHRAVTIAGVEQTELLQAVKDQLLLEAARSTGVREFEKRLDQIFINYGVTPLGRHHIETVFRTNLASVFEQGALEQVLELPDRFPLWRYSAIRDRQTRPTHWDFNGTIWRVADGPIPPIDFNCRCTAIYLHQSEVEKDGLRPERYSREAYVDIKGRLVVYFDNRKNFTTWINQHQGDLSPEVRSWINRRLNQ